MSAPRPYVTVPRDRVWLDAHAPSALSEEFARRGASRPFVLISASLNRPGAAGRAIVEALDGVCGVYDGLSEHTPLERVLEAAVLARALDADLLVAIGGGSVIDGTKAAKAALGDDLWSAEDFARRSLGGAGPEPLTGAGPPIVAVPTTLSAAEFACRAGYTSPLSGLKEGIRALQLAPQSIVLDPQLATQTPMRLWNSTAIRAVDHAVEGIFSAAAWPGLRAQAAAGLGLLARSLRKSAAQPTEPVARSGAQQAVWLISDVLEQVPMGASHGLGYLLGVLGGVPHGLTSCVLLPAVVAWNAPTRPDAAGLVAWALGGAEAANALRDLIAGLGLPTRISQLGIEKGLLDQIAERAIRHPVVRANVRPFQSVQDIRELLESAW